MENEVKEPAPQYNYITPEQYIELKRDSEYKNNTSNGAI